MTAQIYLIVEANVVTNTVLWDGNTETWSPPQESIPLIAETTPAIIWEPVYDDQPKPQVIDYVLQEVMGQGGIGFTWDGTVLTTNEPKPPIPNTTN